MFRLGHKIFSAVRAGFRLGTKVAGAAAKRVGSMAQYVADMGRRGSRMLQGATNMVNNVVGVASDVSRGANKLQRRLKG